jgi:DMSO/TMAO reductase YedYZ molybdopterin-dependent catalytic subunit
MEDSGSPIKLHRGELRLAGVLASGLCMALLWVVAAFYPSDVPFPPTALAEALIRLMPGDLATFFIELLQDWAIRLFGIGVVIASIWLGGEVLLRTTKHDEPRPYVAGAILATLSAAAVVAGPMNDESPIRVTLALVVSWLLFASVAGRFYRTMTDVSEGQADPARRRALCLGVGGVAGLAVGGGALGWLAQRLGGPDTNVTLVAPAEEAVIPERAPFPDIPGLTPEVTSAADHYVVDINLVQPSVSAEGWQLDVFGLVDRPLGLDFQELQTRFDVVEEYQTLTCISNEIGGDLIGNSAWGGVRLRDVLEEAGVKGGAVDVVFTGDEGYTDSIPLDVALDPSTLLAVSQNGEPLRQEHGFPCRVRVPMIYGMKNVKWLREIEVVSKDYKGYWMQRGWSDEAVIHTGSRIDVAGTDRKASMGSATWIAGVAWAGGRGISKVEVSTDGETWNEAMLKEPIGRYSWTLWAYRWTPETNGRVSVVCRATDGDGEVQTASIAPPHPAGSTGYHRVDVDVT